jgi:hypothetical protein
MKSFTQNFLNTFCLFLLMFGCVKSENTVPIDDNKITIGRWEAKFFINSVEQFTNEKYYWTFQNDSLIHYNQKNMVTSDKPLSLIINSDKYSIYSFNDYSQQSIDYKTFLIREGLTEKDYPFIFDFRSSILNLQSGGVQYWYSLPFGIKKMEKSEIILAPLTKKIPFEIRLNKL